MISEATRKASHARVTVRCSCCQAEIERAVCATTRQCVCKPCQDKKQAELKRKYRAEKNGLLFGRLRAPPALPLTLVSWDDDDWPVGAQLPRTAWEQLVSAGDLAGAVFERGRVRYVATNGRLVAQ